MRSRALATLQRLYDLNWPRLILFGANELETAYCIHLVLAALFFSSFFLFGHILVANWDLVSENYPMLLLAKREFWHGSLGLWNPYIFSGVPSAVESNTPLFFPENWLLFLVPDAYLFPTITFVAFVKMWLIGISAYCFYCAELLNRRWALFASIIYQLSGWTIWVIGTYVAASVFLYYTILLALIWTFRRRGDLANFLLLSAAITFMLLAGDIAHPSYALLGAGILVLYRTLSRASFEPMSRLIVVFATSCVAGLLVFCVRLLPTLAMLHASGRNDGCCPSVFANASFLIARLFDSEIFGVQYTESIDFFANISRLFNNFHSHAVMPDFFGVITALLILWALFAEKSRKTAYWSIYTLFLIGVIVFAQPFDALTRVLFSSFYHTQSFHFLMPVGFAALAALGGMTIERNLKHGRISCQTTQFLIAALIIVAMFILMIFIRNVALLAAVGSHAAQLLVSSLILLGVLVALGCRSRFDLAQALVIPLFCCALTVALVLLLFVHSDQNTFISHLKNIGVQLGLFAGLGIVLVLFLRGESRMGWRIAVLGGAVLGFVGLCVTLYPWSTALLSVDIHHLSVTHQQSLVLAGLGALRFVLGIAAFFLVIAAIESQRIPARTIYLVCLFLLFAEQVPAGKIHSYLNTTLLYPADTLYPPLTPFVDTDDRRLDLADYRVNLPIMMLRLPVYDDIWSPTAEACASINAAYRVRSYGGYTDIMPPRNLRFLANWVAPKEPQDFCIYADVADDRFLDLSGVGYSYDLKTATITRRPDALSRFMLFTRFEIISDDQAALQRLKETNFQPALDLVLQRDPGFQSYASDTNGRRLHVPEATSDRVEFQVLADGPALLLFGDSFNPGWNAAVNGAPAEVIRANYNFMAIRVPSGKSSVLLEYKSRALSIGTICAAVGLTVWVFAFAAYLLGRARMQYLRSTP